MKKKQKKNESHSAGKEGTQKKSVNLPPKELKVPGRCPEIAVVFDLAVEPARGILRGFMQYIRLNNPWNVNFISKTASEIDPSSLKNWNGDAILAHVPDEKTFQEILSKNRPTVALAKVDRKELDNDNAEIETKIKCKSKKSGGKTRADLVFIRCDNDAVARMAASFFLERNFVHFAYVPYSREVCWCTERQLAFEKYLSDSGFPLYIFKAGNQEGSDWFTQRDRMRDWLLDLPKPVAVLAANDFRGRQVLEVCQRAGIPVPYQVAVLGVDNDHPICELSYPSLSSIAVDWEKAGFMSAEALNLLMRGEIPPTRLYGPTRIVSRNSTEHLQISDPLVVRILEMIRFNKGENLRVADILKSIHVSERSAQERFKKAMGHSIMEEIKKTRMKNVCELIEETEIPFHEISKSFGFENPNHLGQLFKKEFGMTMSEYRRRKQGS
ncbi:MAG: DNA-binding transcriptional regulator [Planctomycetia bacterium]|nr:DNA-binding transcriptional regulator [Planctomycetia bacterium]